MRRRDFFGICAASTVTCLLPAPPTLAVKCWTITAGDYYATVSIGDKVFEAAHSSVAELLGAGMHGKDVLT